jgi:ATP-dependent protease Clp, ATPase subunit
LLQILTKPKNAVIKQFKKLFRMENIELEFKDEALEAIAEIAIARGTGARALRSILENALMDIMFKVPSKQNITHCIITEDVVRHNKEPMYLNTSKKQAAS